MDFDTEIWDAVFPYRFHNFIWKPWQHFTNSRQWWMGLSCKLEPPILKQLRVQVFSDISHKQKPQLSIRMFPQPKNYQTFHCESGFPILRPISFHELHRSIESFQLSRVACLISGTTLQPRSRGHTVFISVSKLYIKVHKAQIEQN